MSNAKLTANRDIFNEIADRDAVLAVATDRAARRPKGYWRVSLGNGRITFRLMSYNKARKLASRYNRMFGTDIAYAVR